jgi:hypothetical protein
MTAARNNDIGQGFLNVPVIGNDPFSDGKKWQNWQIDIALSARPIMQIILKKYGAILLIDAMPDSNLAKVYMQKPTSNVTTTTGFIGDWRRTRPRIEYNIHAASSIVGRWFLSGVMVLLGGDKK